MVLVYTLFSIIVIFCNLFRIQPSINSALYLSCILCFIGNFLLMLHNPAHVIALTIRIPYLNQLPAIMIHLMNHLYHILPIWLFRYRQSISDIFSVKSYLIAVGIFVVYVLLIPDDNIYDNYAVRKDQFIVGFFTIVLLTWIYAL